MSDADVIAAAREQALNTAREAFAKLDVNGDGTVTKEELRGLASTSTDGLGANASEIESKLEEFVQTFDADGDGKVQLNEWLEFFGRLFDEVIASSMAQ